MKPQLIPVDDGISFGLSNEQGSLNWKSEVWLNSLQLNLKYNQSLLEVAFQIFFNRISSFAGSTVFHYFDFAMPSFRANQASGS